jgi:molecular chaperone IbpA
MTKYNNDPFSFGNFPKQFNTTVGFEPLLKKIAEIAESVPSVYPPYNVRKTGENTYVIEMAVAGFGQHDIELTMQDGILTVTGSTKSDESKEYLYKGIADRAFTRKFTIADSVEIRNADLINGMLKIWLERFIPEEKKAKTIPINGEDTTSKPEFLAEKKVAM